MHRLKLTNLVTLQNNSFNFFLLFVVLSFVTVEKEVVTFCKPDGRINILILIRLIIHVEECLLYELNLSILFVFSNFVKYFLSNHSWIKWNFISQDNKFLLISNSIILIQIFSISSLLPTFLFFVIKYILSKALNTKFYTLSLLGLLIRPYENVLTLITIFYLAWLTIFKTVEINDFPISWWTIPMNAYILCLYNIIIESLYLDETC